MTSQSFAANIATVIVFIVGALFGTGAIWQIKKNELDKIKQACELRKQIESQLLSVIELTTKYLDAHIKSKIAGDSNDKNEAYTYKVRLDMAKENLVSFEEKLAGIENRKPRDIQTWFIPTNPPSSIRIR